jgi:hypothetical protein
VQHSTKGSSSTKKEVPVTQLYDVCTVSQLLGAHQVGTRHDWAGLAYMCEAAAACATSCSSAILPVLAWLAAGLRSRLPPAATQQAHELTCALLGVVSRVLLDGVMQMLLNDPCPDKPLVTAVLHSVKPLGSQGEVQY